MRTTTQLRVYEYDYTAVPKVTSHNCTYHILCFTKECFWKGIYSITAVICEEYGYQQQPQQQQLQYTIIIDI